VGDGGPIVEVKSLHHKLAIRGTGVGAVVRIALPKCEHVGLASPSSHRVLRQLRWPQTLTNAAQPHPATPPSNPAPLSIT